ncbi:ABC transporter [Burkholderia pseudomultivorans]|uniref:ABC transporter permease n=1 Tax=Burkholderia pseudomultivorans TaxID=1207504 RepID=UPI00075B3B51|nr:ABC transporter permease [Burkholderia pseudomultivorans]KVC41761.1 ABC transporter [Burkholderia pseudomultivorans]
MKLESPFKANRSSLQIVRSVLFALFMREMQTRFGARRMGFVWVVFEPLAILVVILVFHAALHTAPMRGIDFVMFLFSGIAPFHMMRNIAWRLTDSIQANQGLFSYRQVMPFDTFVARLIVELCTYSCAYFIICFFLGFWLKHDVLINDPLAWLGALGVGILLSFAFGMAFAMIGNSIPNSSRICKLSFIPLYVTSGVFFPIWNLPHEKMYLFALNPYVGIIDGIRSATFQNYPVTKGVGIEYSIFFALTLLFVVMMMYRRQRQTLRAPKV